ncbi:MAG: histidinol dehydrogenase [Actinomycetota bacterium]|nr:histidinol dehydrogenase [Actinomycetota bacterium]
MLELIDGRAQQTPVHIRRPTAVGLAAKAEASARDIVEDVRLRGDAALVEHASKFEGASLEIEHLRVDPHDILKSRNLVRPELLEALQVMADRLRSTCEAGMPESWLEQREDEFVGELMRPLSRVGIYAPGGRAAYPSTVIMGSVPAQVAGVGAIAVCSPRQATGEIAEPVLAACAVAGIDEVYRAGGAQAIGALAYGTESVRPVDKIVGPGNQYVTYAKRAVAGWVGTDSEAGPTELAVVADESVDPATVALDLIAQAEHGPHGTHVLISWVPELVAAVDEQLDRLALVHENPDDVENALIEGGRGVIVRDRRHALDTVNAFAPEHLQLCFAGARDALDHIRNAGSVFVGNNSPVPVGDYVGGTNHVLPSGGTARWASGLGVNDFIKRIYVSGFEPSALERLQPHVEALSEAEGLQGHARALEARLLDRGRRAP